MVKMPTLYRMVPLLVLLTATGTAPALDSNFRLVYLQPWGDTGISSASGIDSGDWDAAHRWGVQYLIVLDLPLLAFHAGIEAAREERSDPGVDYDVIAGQLVIGGRLTLLPALLHVEANVQAGYGVAELDLSASGSDDGDWLGGSAGLDLVGSLPIPGLFRIELGLGVGWLRTESSHEIANQAIDVTADDNLYGRLFLGLSF